MIVNYMKESGDKKKKKSQSGDQQRIKDDDEGERGTLPGNQPKFQAWESCMI